MSTASVTVAIPDGPDRVASRCTACRRHVTNGIAAEAGAMTGYTRSPTISATAGAATRASPMRRSGDLTLISR